MIVARGVAVSIMFGVAASLIAHGLGGTWFATGATFLFVGSFFFMLLTARFVGLK